MSTPELTCDKCIHSHRIPATDEQKAAEKKESLPDQWTCLLNPPQIVYVNFFIQPLPSLDQRMPSPLSLQLKKIDWVHTRVSPDCMACSHFVAKETH